MHHDYQNIVTALEYSAIGPPDVACSIEPGGLTSPRQAARLPCLSRGAGQADCHGSIRPMRIAYRTKCAVVFSPRRLYIPAL